MSDVVLVGAGLAGLAASAGLRQAGLSVRHIDPASPGDDHRTTAVLVPGRRLLERLGAWDRLAADATPLRVMRIVDASGTAPVARDFDSADLGDDPFGWNLPNASLRAALAAVAAPVERAGYVRHVARESEVIVTDAATTSRARLLIGADGRDSRVREGAGIGVRRHAAGQVALVFAVTHSEPHHDVSIEVHRRGGPFTLVPLPARDGLPRSSVVWMEEGPEAARLAALPDDAFAAAATERSAGVLGPLALDGPRQSWPLATVTASAMTARRVALMAEAAHAMPPIGAQGLNTSLADLAALLDLVESDPDRIGEPGWLAAYARERETAVAVRVGGIDLLNLVSRQGAAPAQALRRLGIAAAHDLAPLRRGLMRLGLGG